MPIDERGIEVREEIVGWGVDRDRERRPGVPREIEAGVETETRFGRSPVTETVPLRGLSGLMRKAAYRREDWQTSRWMLLLLADRVDVIESALLSRGGLFALGSGALALVAGALALRRRRR
jgi:hypothetical protein